MCYVIIIKKCEISTKFAIKLALNLSISHFLSIILGNWSGENLQSTFVKLIKANTLNECSLSFYPQISFEISTIYFSFAHCSSSVNKFPW